MSILYSVLVPMYNVDLYLKKCIESALDRSHVHFELVLVDDRSTDSSGLICDRCAQQDSRSIVHHQANQGNTMARRKAFELPNGEYCVHLDWDDYWDARRLFTRICGYNYIETHWVVTVVNEI